MIRLPNVGVGDRCKITYLNRLTTRFLDLVPCSVQAPRPVLPFHRPAAPAIDHAIVTVILPFISLSRSVTVRVGVPVVNSVSSPENVTVPASLDWKV